MGNWLSIAPSWMETCNKIREQGYVWIRTDNNYIHKESLSNKVYLTVFLYPEIIIRQSDYGKTFALTKEELV